mmetsp:Transcript_25386/g.47389  ORF Transcript_25386/g.47389 Transcript_25386/m.47389 type:complete len:202 (+) Transcript_25386:741-1346(+)
MVTPCRNSSSSLNLRVLVFREFIEERHYRWLPRRFFINGTLWQPKLSPPVAAPGEHLCAHLSLHHIEPHHNGSRVPCPSRCLNDSHLLKCRVWVGDFERIGRVSWRKVPCAQLPALIAPPDEHVSAFHNRDGVGMPCANAGHLARKTRYSLWDVLKRVRFWMGSEAQSSVLYASPCKHIAAVRESQGVVAARSHLLDRRFS